MTPEPEWTPEQQEFIYSFRALDDVTRTIGMLMLDNLPLQTVKKLLRLAELAWRDQDPDGHLVFFDIETPSPKVKFYPKRDTIQVALLAHSSNRFAISLQAIFELAMHRSKDSKLQ